MDDVDQTDVDVISTEDASEKKGDSSKCAYCDCTKDGIVAFHCDGCKRWVHSNCLHSGPPNSVLGDNYFSFTCSSCSGGKELYVRMKVTWLQVVSLALYNLAQTSMGKQGYFKWKEDICLFIDTHWESFFGQTKKKTTQWSCTVGSILSLGNPQHFQSGFGVFTDSGWWRLLDPTRAPEYVPGAAITSTPKCKPKKIPFGSARSGSRKRSHMSRHARMKRALLAKETTANEQKTPVDSPLSNVVGEPPSQPSSPCTSVSSAESKIMVKKEVKIDSTLPLVALSDDDSDADSIFTDFGKKDDATSYANHTESIKDVVSCAPFKGN
uniref:Zinc finger PHD-type domain-containing protein n=1 Tax=Ciona savignyi TaxID=51511 RepID=H2Z2D3_CIOSA